MCNSFYELAHLAIGSDDMCNIVIEGITDLKTKLISNGGDNGSSRYIPTLNNDTSKENCNILSPRADFETLESDRFANVDVPPTSDHDGNILATQEGLMIEIEILEGERGVLDSKSDGGGDEKQKLKKKKWVWGERRGEMAVMSGEVKDERMRKRC
ncbi:hypothetical protein Q3G72_010986 [Acer saccharum]|nr:hypothetical protein Q3G72_010986 [Acer saccharum]